MPTGQPTIGNSAPRRSSQVMLYYVKCAIQANPSSVLGQKEASVAWEGPGARKHTEERDRDRLCTSMKFSENKKINKYFKRKMGHTKVNTYIFSSKVWRTVQGQCRKMVEREKVIVVFKIL